MNALVSDSVKDHAHDGALKRLVEYWQTLAPQSMATLDRYYTEDATFRDPFNEVRGVEPIRHIFADMFVRLEQPRFTIVETILQGGDATLRVLVGSAPPAGRGSPSS